MENISVQRRAFLRSAAAGVALAGLGGCGGGGGGSSTAVAPASAPPAASPVPPTTPSVTTVAFANVSVHDPSVIKSGDAYYVFGSHLAAAKPPTG